MILILENFKMAIASIRANKMRAFLTMLGIIIGISSVVTITSVGESTQKTMNKFFSGFGKNRVILSMDLTREDTFDENKQFGFEDIQYLQDKFKDQIKYIAPMVGDKKTIKMSNRKADLTFTGVQKNYIKDMSNYKIIDGRDLDQRDIDGRKNVVLVDEVFAEKMFGRKYVAGEQFNTTINNQDRNMIIIGVYSKEKTIFDKLDGGDSTMALVPYTLFNGTYSGYLDLKISEDLNLNREMKKFKDFVVRYKRATPETYKISSLAEQTGMINGILGMLSLGLGAIAAISLVVGGIGIMNIMLVSVTERTKEIGIRKSLGARKKDILMQFLIESVILSGVGGMIGVIFGLIFSRIATNMMKLEGYISIRSIIIAVLFSFAVGMFFGIVPANKAAKLNPIDALRYE